MGILDDAIREHLDLKRSRGADPAEVTQQEHEALGPVRREPEPSAEVDPEAPVADEPAPMAEEAAAAHDPAPEASTAPGAVSITHPPPAAGQETEEWGFEDDEEPVAGPLDEDPLEETPDFLQETPEHDRLWFEQKPPRDFDFDS